MAKRSQEMTRTVSANARFVRMSPYKVREVAQLIRGKQIDEARRILAFTPKAASKEIAKVLEAAIANAEHNFQIPQEELLVKVASADEGLTIKRFRPRAQGRAFRIRKRTSHINLVLERMTDEQLERLHQPKPKRQDKTPDAPKKSDKPKKAAPAGAAASAEKPKRARKPKAEVAAVEVAETEEVVVAEEAPVAPEPPTVEVADTTEAAPVTDENKEEGEA